MRRAIFSFVLALRRFHKKSAWVLCSHIAMSMMLALFPFVLFTVALAGAVANLVSHDLRLQQLVDLVFGTWPVEVSGPILRELYAVLESSSPGLATFGGVLALFFASNGVNAIRFAMVRAYHDVDERPFWLSRLICLGLVILGGSGILIAAVFEIAIPLYVAYFSELFPHFDLLNGLGKGMNRALVLGMPFLAVLLCHLFLPGRIHPMREILPGVLVTVFLWWIAGIGFAFYVSSIAQYSATYAGLAGAIAAIIFLYVNAAILILGAEFNGALIDSA